VRFVPNLFPYQVPQGTSHYVLWFLLAAAAMPSEQEINQALEREFVELKVSEEVSPSPSVFFFR